MLLRTLLAGFLLWHPGFSEATAYLVLLILLTLGTLGEVLRFWVESGGPTAFVALLFAACGGLVMWNQTWFSPHTVLVTNFVLQVALLVFVGVVKAAVATRRPTARALA